MRSFLSCKVEHVKFMKIITNVFGYQYYGSIRTIFLIILFISLIETQILINYSFFSTLTFRNEKKKNQVSDAAQTINLHNKGVQGKVHKNVAS